MGKIPTTLLIRPAARGGKYLGHDAANTKNYSAFVAILHPDTGGIIAYDFAKAPNEESAGPENLMDPVRRSEPFPADSNTVHVQLTVEISEPTDFKVLVHGPLSYPGQARTAEADITVLPGINIGTETKYPEGLVIEVPGLCISNVTADWQGSQVTCTAKVTMMCGCQIHDGVKDPEWPWLASDFSIQMVTYMESDAVHSYKLKYDKNSGTVSSFTGQWPNQAIKGDTVKQAWIYAFEPKLGNQGKYRIFPSPYRYPLQQLPPEVQKLLSEIVDH